MRKSLCSLIVLIFSASCFNAWALNGAVDSQLRVTHIRFDYKAANTTNGDGLKIRYNYSNALAHAGNGGGFGEWIRPGSQSELGGVAGRNEPVLWIAKDMDKFSARFESIKIKSATIYAKFVFTLSSNGNTRTMTTNKRTVTFGAPNTKKPEPTQSFEKESQGGDDTPTTPAGTQAEWYIFTFNEPVPEMIERMDGTATWYATEFTTDDGVVHTEGSTGWAFDTTPQASQKTWDGKAAAHVMYIVLDGPKSPWYDKPAQQARVDALEFTIVTANTRGITALVPAAVKVTTFVDNGYGLKYDTVNGAPKYTTASCSEYRFTNFIKKTSSIVNCYDCAGSVMLMSNLVGNSMQYNYLEPFGFLKQTYLIGIGQCNNPFKKPLIVPVGASGRSQFGNHAFDILNGKVFDACAGPHTGTEDVTQYKNNAIDPPVSTATPAPAGSTVVK